MVTVQAKDDGVRAEGRQIIDGGTVEVTAAVESLEAAVFVLNAGDVRVTASDDGVNGAGGTTDTTAADGAADAGGMPPGDAAAGTRGAPPADAAGSRGGGFPGGGPGGGGPGGGGPVVKRSGTSR